MTSVAVYSFQDVTATLVSPTGASIDLANGSGNAKGGITIEHSESTNKMDIGADGICMHNRKADSSAKIKIQMLRTSPTNGAMCELFNIERQSSILWGKNILVLNVNQTGEQVIGNSIAFNKMPNLSFAEEGGMIEWDLDCGNCEVRMSDGSLY